MTSTNTFIMKKYGLILLFIGTAMTANGQTFAELFKQKKTQKKYLIQQIAALKVYGSYLEKGYAIAREGLEIIGALKDGELNLHRAFFHSLESVSPPVKAYARVADIVALQAALVRDCNRVAKQLSRHDFFNPQERDYLYGVFDQLLADGLATVNALMLVISPGKLQMTEAGRLDRIDRLYKSTRAQCVFSKKFIRQIKGMAAYRKHQQRDALTGYALYGIKTRQP